MDICLGILVLIGAVTMVGWDRWRFLNQWLRGCRARRWPTAAASIGTVSVAKQVTSVDGAEVVTFVATLTYFYSTPDRQVGEFSKLFAFGDEQSANTWANSYKNSRVVIHVNPKNAADSVLRGEDLKSAK